MSTGHPSAADRARVTLHQADAVLSASFAQLRVQLQRNAIKGFSKKAAQLIEIEQVKTMLEQTRRSIDSQLEPLFQNFRKSSILIVENNERQPVAEAEAVEEVQVSRCRLNHVLGTDIAKFLDELSRSPRSNRAKKPRPMNIPIATVLQQLELAQKNIVTQLHWPPIDELPDLALLLVFQNLSHFEKINDRLVCPRFKILLEEKCRITVKSLKLFAVNSGETAKVNQAKFKYSHLLAQQLPKPADDILHLYHNKHADDLAVDKDALNDPQIVHQIAQLVPAVRTLVLCSFNFDLRTLEAFTNLTTLFVHFPLDGRRPHLWTSLASLPSLSRLYLFDYQLEEKSETKEAIRTVLSRLCCFHNFEFEMPFMSLDMFSAERLEQLSFTFFWESQDFYDSYWRNSWSYICNNLPKLTYLQIPSMPSTTGSFTRFLYQQLKNLKHLKELKLNFATLPSVAAIREHSLEHRSIETLILGVYDNENARSIIALFPVLKQVVVIPNPPNSDRFEQFCLQLNNRKIEVVDSTERMKPMIGPFWSEYQQRYD